MAFKEKKVNNNIPVPGHQSAAKFSITWLSSLFLTGSYYCASHSIAQPNHYTYTYPMPIELEINHPCGGYIAHPTRPDLSCTLIMMM